MLRRAATIFSRVVHHPVTKFVTGLLMVMSAGSDLMDDFRQGWESFELGVHHGVALLGVMQMFGAIADLLDGLDLVDPDHLEKPE